MILKRITGLSVSYPKAFNSVNALTLAAIGDTVQQSLDLNKLLFNQESKNSQNGQQGQNWYQTFMMSFYSLLATQPLIPYYLKILPRLAPVSKVPTFLQVLRKVTVSHLMLCPL